MSQGVITFCVLTLLALSYESEYERLSSIDDLLTVYSKKSLPMHSLILLHWFANNIDLDSNNVVRLSFDPNADFGSHCYDNYDGLLAPAPLGYQYYTVGNLNPPNGNMCPRARGFPEYVISHPQVIEVADMGRNRDRIIVQAQNYGPHRVSQMYLTQHFRRQDNQGSRYDPDHTFEISTNLLQQLRLFSFNNNKRRSLQELRDQFDQNIDDTQLNDIVNIWGRDQAPLGLLFLIVNPQRANLVGVCRSSRSWVRDVKLNKTGKWQNCELQQTHLYVKTGSKGKSQIVWKNVTQNQLNDGAAVVLFKNQEQDESNTYTWINSSQGSYDTSVPLNEGLQVRLHKAEHFLTTTIKEEIWRGEEFKSPDAVPINGYAQLQLFVRNAKACFLLYVKKGCNEWKSDFYYSWVGLYKSDEVDAQTSMREQWQWAIYFKQGLDSGDDETFEYCTDTTIATGLQARFMIKDYNEKARTPVWG